MSRKKYQEFYTNVRIKVVRDASAVRRLFVRLAVAVGRQSALHKENCGFAAPTLCRHISWLSDFIFYPKLLYKSLHQSFFYSFITILPSESAVTLKYSTTFTQTRFECANIEICLEVQALIRQNNSILISLGPSQPRLSVSRVNLISLRLGFRRNFLTIFILISFQGLSKVFWKFKM